MIASIKKFGITNKLEIDVFLAKIDPRDDGVVTRQGFQAGIDHVLQGRKLNIAERTYLTFEDPMCCGLAKIISYVVMCAIVCSTFLFVIESLPTFRSAPDGCRDVADLSCQPLPNTPIFASFEAVAIFIFSMEYVSRFLTVGFVRKANVLRAGTEDADEFDAMAEEAMNGPKDDLGIDIYGEKRKKREKAVNSAAFKDMFIYRVLKFVLHPMNLIDLVAILPWYLEQFMADAEGGGDGLMVLRILRLGRVVRMLKLGKNSAGITMFVNAFKESAPILFLLCFVFVLIAVLFGALLFVTELGVWVEPGDLCKFPGGEVKCGTRFPYGEYLRMGLQGYHEVSPFVSIPHSSWCVFTTITTVGYGDFVATTTAGRMISVVMMVIGLVVVALPITVIGGSFARQVSQQHEQKFRSQQREMRAYLRFLKKEVDKHEPHSLEYCKLMNTIQGVEKKLKERFVMGQKVVGEDSPAVDTTQHPGAIADPKDALREMQRRQSELLNRSATPPPAILNAPSGMSAGMSTEIMQRLNRLEMQNTRTAQAVESLSKQLASINFNLIAKEQMGALNSGNSGGNSGSSIGSLPMAAPLGVDSLVAHAEGEARILV